MATNNNILVVWHTGQSNAHGNKPGEAVNTPEVDYYDTLLGETDPAPSTTFHPLHGTGATTGHTDGDNHGSDSTIGKLLVAAGYRVALINLSRGSTFAYSWIPADPERGVTEGNTWAPWVSESANAWALLQAQYPNATFRHVHIRDQGTSDMRLPLTGGWPAIVGRWAEDTQIVHDSLEALVGQTVPKICWMSSINLTQAGESGPTANHTAAIRAQQELWCPPEGRIYADGNDVVEYDSLEFTHLTQLGYTQIIPMGSIAVGARNAGINHEMNKAAYTPPATHYFHWYAAGGVPLNSATNAPGYAPVAIANNTTLWPAPSGRAVSNGVAITTPAPSGSWPDVTEVRCTDSPTEGAGTLLASNTFAAMPANQGTGPLSIGIGNFVVSLPAENWSDTAVHRVLGLLFGGTTYTADTTLYVSYWAGDPKGAGAQVGSRVAVTKATVFALASGGASYTQAAVSLTHQATGTYVAVHDASSGGNLLYSCPRPTTLGLTGSIVSGQWRVQMT
jgi:hypothetical protein